MLRTRSILVGSRMYETRGCQAYVIDGSVCVDYSTLTSSRTMNAGSESKPSPYFRLLH